jgi:hypothetical protein
MIMSGEFLCMMIVFYSSFSLWSELRHDFLGSQSFAKEKIIENIFTIGISRK